MIRLHLGRGPQDQRGLANILKMAVWCPGSNGVEGRWALSRVGQSVPGRGRKHAQAGLGREPQRKFTKCEVGEASFNHLFVNNQSQRLLSWPGSWGSMLLPAGTEVWPRPGRLGRPRTAVFHQAEFRRPMELGLGPQGECVS